MYNHNLKAFSQWILPQKKKLYFYAFPFEYQLFTTKERNRSLLSHGKPSNFHFIFNPLAFFFLFLFAVPYRWRALEVTLEEGLQCSYISFLIYFLCLWRRVKLCFSGVGYKIKGYSSVTVWKWHTKEWILRGKANRFGFADKYFSALLIFSYLIIINSLTFE